MSESANAAFVRRTYELVNAGEFEELAAGFAEGFEWHPDALSPGQSTRRTPDAVVVRHIGRVGSGDVERREAHLWTFAAGRPRSLREFEDRSSALDAAHNPHL
jgi:ketosteroid isomerase-like protein